MLASGSLYVFSLYAPSFTGQLGYSQTQTSAIGTIGNLGIYGSGPVAGHMADRFGPRATSLFAALLVGLGYGLLFVGYSSSVDNMERGLPPTPFILMAFYLFSAGVGNSASYMAAFTSLIKNFKQGRGIALGFPIGFFGLSAAVLTIIAQNFFMIKASNHSDTQERLELDTGRFLLFLGLFGGLVNVIAMVGLSIVPAPEIELPDDMQGERIITPSPPQNAAPSVQEDDEQTPLMREGIVGATMPPVRAPQHSNAISGKALFLDSNAQLFFFVILWLAGTGLMIINSISAIVDAVAASESEGLSVGHEGRPLASVRAIHVGLISVSSYAGRILAGFGSDVAIQRYGAYRIDVVPLASICMALGQLVGMFAPLRWLYLCSILTGFAYGTFFGIVPTVVAELWGEETCGQNWGWLSWGAAVGGMLFNLLFGVVVDASRPVVDGEPQACKGHRCFRLALLTSFVACVLSFYVSFSMGKRQRRAGG
ncbi:hypothetical protein BGZ65_004957 [Modicella reniformis]|uniref:Nodulin-like domain-containing protein n=1 Tax=Modicella reniformis TaxID=1440133 RepID=A0A9P6M8R1_9FUNG|nr:hypothetical protein BGZ65_004957 [Modicella reniformis]